LRRRSHACVPGCDHAGIPRLEHWRASCISLVRLPEREVASWCCVMLRGRAIQIAMFLLLVPAVALLIVQMTAQLQQRTTQNQQVERRRTVSPAISVAPHKTNVPPRTDKLASAESAWSAASTQACKTTFADEPRRAVLVTNIRHSSTYDLVMMLRSAGRSVVAVNDAVTETCVASLPACIRPNHPIAWAGAAGIRRRRPGKAPSCGW
jgi:hypothetical protein